MSDDNRFFRWLGRINSMLFFLAVAGAIVLMGGETLMWGLMSRDAPVAAKAKSGDDTYAFGGTIGAPGPNTGSWEITQLDGADEGVMVLQRTGDRSYGSLSSSGRDSNDVNLLLINLKTMKNHWLFQGVKRDIGQALLVHALVPVPQNSPDPVTALLIPVMEADTNGDGRITAADDHVLYLYRVGAERAVKVFDAKSISGMDQLDSERILVTYFDGRNDRAMLVSAKTFKPIADTVLSPTPN